MAALSNMQPPNGKARQLQQFLHHKIARPNQNHMQYAAEPRPYIQFTYIY